MAEESIERIIQALDTKGANKPCARCGNEHFQAVSKTRIPIQDDFTMVEIGGESIPALIIACKNCGNLSTHALGALGLLKGETK